MLSGGDAGAGNSELARQIAESLRGKIPPGVDSSQIERLVREAVAARTAAPAHIVHGSSVTASVQPVRRQSPNAAPACRNARISAWAVGSDRPMGALPAAASTDPSADNTTAPMGASPAAPASRAP